MNTDRTTDTNKADYQPDMNPLMAAYNPLPPQAESSTGFYWQTWQDPSSDKGVQEAFES